MTGNATKKLVSLFRKEPATGVAANGLPLTTGRPIPGLVAPDLTYTEVDLARELAFVEDTLTDNPDMLDEGTPDVLDGELISRHLHRVHLLDEKAALLWRAATEYISDIDRVTAELRPHLLAARAEYNQLVNAHSAWDSVLSGESEEYIHPKPSDGTQPLPAPGTNHPSKESDTELLTSATHPQSTPFDDHRSELVSDDERLPFAMEDHRSDIPYPRIATQPGRGSGTTFEEDTTSAEKASEDAGHRGTIRHPGSALHPVDNPDPTDRSA